MLYGDMADPEIHEQLSLGKGRWVVSTVRSLPLSLGLIELLKQRGFRGRIAVTAASREEARQREAAGAQVVFRPFRDAAEQAADALTQAIDLLPESVDWSIAFREVRVQSRSLFNGREARLIPLREETGVSILAISRAGTVHYDPHPDFRIYPGDRLVLIGTPEELLQGEDLLNQIQADGGESSPERFVLSEVAVGKDSPWSGRTVADLAFRQKYGGTVAGIRREAQQSTAPLSSGRLTAGDRLVVIDSAAAVERLQDGAPLRSPSCHPGPLIPLTWKGKDGREAQVGRERTATGTAAPKDGGRYDGRGEKRCSSNSDRWDRWRSLPTWWGTRRAARPWSLIRPRRWMA